MILFVVAASPGKLFCSLSLSPHPGFHMPWESRRAPASSLDLAHSLNYVSNVSRWTFFFFWPRSTGYAVSCFPTTSSDWSLTSCSGRGVLTPGLPGNSKSLLGRWTSLVAQMVEHLTTMRETQVRSLGWEDPQEKEMATHSSTLAWKISWTEEHGRLQSMGSQRVGHNWATSLSCLPASCILHGGLYLLGYPEPWLSFPCLFPSFPILF